MSLRGLDQSRCGHHFVFLPRVSEEGAPEPESHSGHRKDAKALPPPVVPVVLTRSTEE